MQTPWPVIWSRSLRSGTAIARSNALSAARVVTERRLEREAQLQAAELRLLEQQYLIGVREGFGDPSQG